MCNHSGLLASLAILLACGQMNQALGDENQRIIRVSGVGQASVKPDMAIIQTGVVTQSANAVDAMNENNEVVQKLMAELKNRQVAERDIQTSQFNVQPEYERGPRREPKPDIIGYKVTNQLRIRVRNLTELGELLDTLIRSGSNQVSGIGFSVDDMSAVMSQARINAIEDAKQRALLYAKAAGVNVGKVLAIDEQRAEIPQPRMMGRTMKMASNVPIATGEQDFSATVHMTFELVDQ